MSHSHLPGKRLSLALVETPTRRVNKWPVYSVCILLTAWVMFRIISNWNYPIFDEQEDHSFVETSTGFELRNDILDLLRQKNGGHIRQAIFFSSGLAVFDDRGQVFEIDIGESGADPPVFLLGIYHHAGDPHTYKLRHPYQGA